jgi:cytochrome c oxidase cbb3-type subunit 3
MSEEPEIRRAQFAEKDGEVVLRDHEYDGIQEYDQKLPNWWLFIFIAAHVFFVVWWFGYYNLGLTQTDEQKIEAAMAVIEEAQAKALDEMLAKLTDEALVNEWATDPERVSAGRASFQSNCIACHGEDLAARIDIGGGQFVSLPGLPLTDGEWKYGGRPMEIFKLINEGTPPDSSGHNGAKMEAWGLKIPPVEVAELTAYLISENEEEFSK